MGQPVHDWDNLTNELVQIALRQLTEVVEEAHRTIRDLWLNHGDVLPGMEHPKLASAERSLTQAIYALKQIEPQDDPGAGAEVTRLRPADPPAD